MTEADDNVVELRDVDHVFEQILAGELAAPDAPAWCGDVARLVAGAQAPPAGDELAAEDDVVRAMAQLRRAARSGPVAASTPDDATDALVELWSTADAPASADAEPAPEGAPVGPVVPATPVRRLPAAGDVLTAAPSAPGGRRRGPRHVSGRPRHAVGSTGGTGGRQVGRLLAAKTAAVTTAVVVGTVAAAAATTGIVSGVVVPTLAGRIVKTPTSSTIVHEDDGQASTRPGDTLPGGLDVDDETIVTTPSCPTLVLVCSPLTPAGETAPGTGGAATTSPAKSGATGLGSSTTTTTAPSTPEPTTTTSTTVPATPPPTNPEPAPTTSTTAADTPPTTNPEPVGPFSESGPGAQTSD